MLPPRDLPSSRTHRRSFLAGIGAVTGLAAASQIPLAGSALGAPRPRGGDYPFTLGVASGDPHPNGFVIWTRLVPGCSAPTAGCRRRPVPVEWKVARDERMRFVVKRGTVSALPDLAHSVHVELDGLSPDREYYYQFRYRHDVSAGRPHPDRPVRARACGALSFAFASCQDWTHGFYSAYRNMAQEDLDLVVHLGDYVYEYGVPADGAARAAGRAGGPAGGAAGPRPLADAVRALQVRPATCSSRTPASRGSSRGTTTRSPTTTPAPTTPRSRAPRAAAYRAWYEHQPVGRRSLPRRDGSLEIYRRLGLGPARAVRRARHAAVPHGAALRLGRGSGV